MRGQGQLKADEADGSFEKVQRKSIIQPTGNGWPVLHPLHDPILLINGQVGALHSEGTRVAAGQVLKEFRQGPAAVMLTGVDVGHLRRRKHYGETQGRSCLSKVGGPAPHPTSKVAVAASTLACSAKTDASHLARWLSGMA
jgi:hypothetical protein